MNLAELPVQGWEAELRLAYRRRGEQTILAERAHRGPLVVQKSLYPEGTGVCHSLLLHPPGGVAGGDRLQLDIRAEAGSHALVTTPGAGKWYKGNGRSAAQALRFRVENDGLLEWLPQEAILFDGADARWRTEIHLAENAAYLGWDILCLGRTASGERFTTGRLRQTTEINREGKRLWGEYATLRGGDPLLDSLAGLSGCPVSGTFLAVGPKVDDGLLARLREIGADPEKGDRSAVTRLPDLVAARYLGHSAERARSYFTALWKRLRPAFAGREACVPRIWNT